MKHLFTLLALINAPSALAAPAPVTDVVRALSHPKTISCLRKLHALSNRYVISADEAPELEALGGKKQRITLRFNLVHEGDVIAGVATITVEEILAPQPGFEEGDVPYVQGCAFKKEII